MIGEMRELAALVAESRPPAAVLAEAARLTLDSLGCMIAGAQTGIGLTARAVVEPTARSGASVVGLGVASPMAMASAANARMGAAIDADDTYMMLHFGLPAVSAALAVVEARAGSGREVLEAVSVGFEVGARVLRSFGPLVGFESGRISGYARPLWAPVPLVMSAVAAAARALRLPATETEEAIAVAAANTPIPVAHKWAEHTGGRALPTYKYVDAGQCTAVGVDAAALASAGLRGITGLFEGTDSYWSVCGCGDPDLNALRKGIRDDWQILDTSYKPWPSCRWLHYPLTALRRLLEDEPIDPVSVEQIVVHAPAMSCAPQHVTTSPAGWVAAQFSHAHSMAMLLLGIPGNVEWYAAETLRRPDVRALRRRVRVMADERSERLEACIEDGHFKRLPSAIDVLADGRWRSASVDHAFGDPWDAASRMTDDDLAAKFRCLSGLRDARYLSAAVLALATAPTLDPVARALRAVTVADRTGGLEGVA